MSSPFCLRPLLFVLGCATALSGAGIACADTPPAKAEPAPVSKPRPPLSSPQLLLQLMVSEIAYARGDLETALAGYGDLAKRSDDPRISQRANEIATTSILLNASGKPAEAEAAIKAALARQEATRGTLLLQLPGIFARSTDKVATARIIERLSTPYLSLPEAHLARAQAELDAGNAAAAHAAAGEALRLKPDLERAALLQAQSAPPDQLKTSMEALGAFGQRHPQALDARLNYARWLAVEKRSKESTEQYQKMLSEFPDNDALAFAIVGIAAQAEDLATAERLLTRLVQRGWGEVERLRLLLGEVQTERGRRDEALQTFENVRPGAHFVNAQVAKARLLAAQGKTDEAVQSLHEAGARSAESLTALQSAEAQLLRQLGKQEAASKVLQALLAREPDNIEALYDAALLAEQMGQPAQMEQGLRRVIVLKPDHAHALNALGYSFADRNIQLDEAEQLLSKAIKLAPDDAAILDSVGWLHFRQGKLAESLATLQRAYAKFPDAEVAGHLVEVLWASGEQDAARKLMNEALKTSPASVPLKALSARLGL
ncbi:tetratricopeptide repeat protein [Uliginosibacterium flavum]|uniref:Tetratricopeptide repeat protein n=1 Tax=Uliginosibacterium flavum TaxID=1396831 RepID=A0ABV2TK25_9RHOO